MPWHSFDRKQQKLDWLSDCFKVQNTELLEEKSYSLGDLFCKLHVLFLLLRNF
jgi:hypothetical protein